MEQAAQQPQGEALAARRAALDILSAVLDRHQPLDQVLEDHKDFLSLSGRDRAFVRMLTATALRRLGQADDLILRASERNEAPSPPLLHHLMRLGVTQLVFMNVPDHAAVDTAVTLADRIGMGRQKGFVNAVLRRVARDGAAWARQQDEAALNIPAWLTALWAGDYGAMVAGDMALASLAEAPLDISIKNPGMADYWAEQLGAIILPTGTLRRPAGGRIEDLPGFDDGMWWVQDAAAALPVQLLGAVEGRVVIDLCAAPGGKTAQLAARGAQVTALDRSSSRIKRLEENLRRLRLEKTVTVVTADAAVWQPKEKAELVLLDAPCSATGTIRRHPDMPRLKTSQDIMRLAEAQARLLQNAADMLVPGGVMVYCTCSLQKAEGEVQIDALLKARSDLRRLPVAVRDVGGIEGIISEAGDVRILPFHLAAHGGMDGFYIARLQKL